MSVRPSDYPAAVVAGGGDRAADRSGRRAHRGRLPDRRRRPGGARGRDPARPADGGAIPATAERLGDVPVAVLEKGKAPGSHLLSGAVVNPRGLQRLFRDRKRMDELPFYGAGRGGVGALPDEAARVAHPDAADDGQRPQLRRVALAARPVPRRGGGVARRDDPARDGGGEAARRRRPRASACARATAAAGGTARSSANFEPGSDITARVTILSEGTQGHLTGAALDHFGLRSDNPQVWALGVKEVWKVATAARPGDPHDGLAAARRAKYPRVRRLVHLSDGRRHGHDRDGRRPRLHATRSCRCTTCCRS